MCGTSEFIEEDGMGDVETYVVRKDEDPVLVKWRLGEGGSEKEQQYTYPHLFQLSMQPYIQFQTESDESNLNGFLQESMCQVMSTGRKRVGKKSFFPKAQSQLTRTTYQTVQTVQDSPRKSLKSTRPKQVVEKRMRTNDSPSPPPAPQKKRTSIGSRRIVHASNASYSPQMKMLRLVKSPTLQERDQDSLRRKQELVTNEEEFPPNPALEEKKKANAFSHYYKADRDLIDYRLSQHNEKPPLLYSLSLLYQDSQLLPRKLNLKTSQQQDLKLGNYFLGKKHASLLGQLFDNKFKDADLHNSNAPSELFKSMPHAPQFLNLSNNKLSQESCSYIGKFLTNRHENLQEANFEGTKMGNRAALELCNHLKENRSLRVLNLSDCSLDDLFANSFKAVIMVNEGLEEVYFHWNRIRSAGIACILEGIIHRDFVKVVDLSWNQGGSHNSSMVGIGLDKIQKALMKQKKSIVHLDLSFNGFNRKESVMVQQALLMNKSLMGFHFEGNVGYVDVSGFLQIPDDFDQHRILTLKPPHRIRGAKPQPQLQASKSSNSKYRDNCWICDNWQEVTLTWPDVEKQVYVCIKHENFKVLEMELKSDRYEVIRMHPPEKCYFYFIIDNQKCLSDFYNVDNGFNVMDINGNKNIIDDDFDAVIDLDIRTVDKNIDLNRKPVQKKVWKVENSIFRDYKRDTPQLLNSAFESDWASMRVRNEALKETVRKHFALVKDLYRYIAALQVQVNIPNISQNCVHDLMHFFNLKVHGLDIKFVETLNPEKVLASNGVQAQNPIIYQQILNAKGLNRRNFIEFLVRCFGDDYDHIIQTNIQPAFKGYDCDTWRIRRYWNQQCEKVLKTHMTFLQHIFLKYSRSIIKPFNQVKALYFQEFRQIWVDAGLLGRLAEREIALAFLLAQTTQVDEINSDSFLYLRFMEFLEALGRVAERLNMEPKQKKKKINANFLPLCFKIESLILFLNLQIYGQEVDSKYLLNFERYFENVEEQLQFRKLNNLSEKTVEKIQSNQGFSLIKSKLQRSFDLELVFDDGLGIFKNHLKQHDVESDASFSDQPEYENSF